MGAKHSVFNGYSHVQLFLNCFSSPFHCYWPKKFPSEFEGALFADSMDLDIILHGAFNNLFVCKLTLDMFGT